MRIPVVVIKVPLYDYDEDVMVPLEGEVLKEVVESIKTADDVRGWSIGSMELVEEDWEY